MADMEPLKRKLDLRYRRVAEIATRHVYDETWRVAPTRQNGSILEALIASPVVGGAFAFKSTISCGVKQALFTDQGTRGPYVIRARRARVLRFEIDGEVFYRREVVHPGIRAQHWFKRPMPERWRDGLELGLRTAGFR